jgi:hypothetical protein
VQAGNEEEEKKQKQAKECKEKIFEETKKKNTVTMMTAPQPRGLQSTGQPPTLVTGTLFPSRHSLVTFAPVDPPTQEIDPKVLMWTIAQPLFLLSLEQFKSENEKML